ncbi:hypothetical protein MesoLjLa_60410 [Mesorhizobium sp. L-2-11]|nr:hypothetical protein MesoLjLa_60410 [Mesorhizobium sp. L-2-11]
MNHELVRLARTIDWPVLEARFGEVYCDGPGMAATDPADAEAGYPQAHLQPVRRGAVRTLGREPVFPVPVRRGVLPPRAAVRPLLDLYQRYAHAKQFKRANKTLRRLRTYLGRTVRDISRQIAGDPELDAIFKWPLYQASTVLEQRQRQRGRKIYRLHAMRSSASARARRTRPSSSG